MWHRVIGSIWNPNCEFTHEARRVTSRVWIAAAKPALKTRSSNRVFLWIRGQTSRCSVLHPLRGTSPHCGRSLPAGGGPSRGAGTENRPQIPAAPGRGIRFPADCHPPRFFARPPLTSRRTGYKVDDIFNFAGVSSCRANLSFQSKWHRCCAPCSCWPRRRPCLLYTSDAADE